MNQSNALPCFLCVIYSGESSEPPYVSHRGVYRKKAFKINAKHEDVGLTLKKVWKQELVTSDDLLKSGK